MYKADPGITRIKAKIKLGMFRIKIGIIMKLRSKYGKCDTGKGCKKQG